MPTSVWTGQLTFGLVTFPVRLIRAARKERIPLKLVRRVPQPPEPDEAPTNLRIVRKPDPAPAVEPVRRSYTIPESDSPLPPQEVEHAFQTAPDTFALLPSAKMRALRAPTSGEAQIVRSVPMNQIDPVFLETSYYVIPGPAAERPYALFFRALQDTQLAALAEIAMHGREHILVIRAGQKGLIAHTLFYVDEVRRPQEYDTSATDVSDRELALATHFVQAIQDAFRPEEFQDLYRQRLQALIDASEPATAQTATPKAAPARAGDLLEALRRSIEMAGKPAARKPALPDPGSAKPRRKSRKTS